MLVILDYNVIVHRISNSLDKTALEQNLGNKRAYNKKVRQIIRQQLYYSLSSVWLPPEWEGSKFILADDKKMDGNYWRHEYFVSVSDKVTRHRKADQDKVIQYKDGRGKDARKLKQYTFVRETCDKILYEMKLERVYFTNYEADDVSAALVMLNNRYKIYDKVLLATVDSDWTGLVQEPGGELPQVSWYCAGGFEPRLRDSVDVINKWMRNVHKLKEDFTEPADIWAYKSKYGDTSDKIPKVKAGSEYLLPGIHLKNPPLNRRLWVTKQIALTKKLSECNKTLISTELGEQILESFHANSITPALPPFKKEIYPLVC